MSPGAQLLPDGPVVERLATGATWSEGPLWIPDERAVRWSDIPGNRILRWDAATGVAGVHRTDVEFTNGRLLDPDGTVVQCSHGLRRLEREHPDGTTTELVADWNGHRLNSPNDVARAPDGSYWFTDPDYGIVQPNEGHPGEHEYGDCRVFRWSPVDGLTSVIDDIDRPNGIAFSPDGLTVYVTDTASGLGDGPGHWIRAYDVTGPRASNGRHFATIDAGLPDGIAVDVEGRVWSSAGDGIHVFDEEGTELLFVPVPEVVANVCFGGDDGTDLFIAATTSLYRLRTSTRSPG
ncbi:SMP-30/gluconolactonase/LRE family protein [Microbacterium flavescens]|uniref:SMP-30/gluconolactonase/LRE family protein n=1 Tax=Microbacterium flavescens TaxID=69366 RepID=UPI001BDF3AFC|nr:SMP-30/gluconolactonase/LRE family protein [Microbacterium flavescens]BFF10088.1 SMP-30/gluconolactonase/LRE family protein [Microbacterium flavescens]